MAEDPAPTEAPHIRESKRAATRTSAISLRVIWVLAAALSTFDAVRAHSYGRPLSAFLWIGLVCCVLFAASIVRVRRRLNTRYPKL